MSDEDATIVNMSPQAVDLVEQYREEKRRAKEHGDRASALGEQIMHYLHVAADTEPETIVGHWADEPVIRMSVVWTRRLDTEKVKKSAPTVYDEFSVTRPSVRLTIPAVPS